MILRTHDDEMIALLKTTFDAFLIIAVFISGALTINMPIQSFTTWEYTLAMVGASISGALILVYYRRELSYKEMFFKAGCAAISGLFFGSMLTAYLAVEKTPYVFGTYFLAAMLSMFIIRGLLAFTEANAQGLIITILQKFLPANGSTLPKVTPDHSVTPEMVVKETVVTIEKTTEKTD